MPPCARCGETHVEDLMTCVGNLITKLEQADRAAMMYLPDLHQALRYALAVEWLRSECPACGGSSPTHQAGCFVAAFLDKSGARHLPPNRCVDR